jgi:cytochrome c553
MHPPLTALRRPLRLLLAAVLLAPAGPAASLDFSSLERLIAERDVGSIEELIAVLPPGLRSRYALVFESRSLQGASFENPRAILFGSDAHFIVTFNGSATQRGFRAVETMEFDESTREFRLRELTFPEHAAGAAGVSISEPNPQRCARCHGTPPHPVWDSFPLWPGAYGERYGARLSARERAGLRTFMAREAAHPRYRLLIGAGQFADPATFRPGAPGRYSAAPREPPNAALAIELTRLRARSIARQLASQPEFPSYQYALLGLADPACGSPADFYPELLWRTARPAFARFAAATAAANLRQAQLKAVRAGAGIPGAAADTASDDTLLPLRFVAESALGMTTGDWSLALERNTYDFALPALVQPWREALLAELAPRDAAIRTLSDYSTSADGDRYCSYLKRRSREALAVAAARVEASTQPPAAAAPGAPAARPPALQLCVSCHESGAAPALPFSDPLQLARELRVRTTPHGPLIDEIRFRLSAAAGARHMPAGLNLSDAERESLEAYFAALLAAPN